MSEKPILPKDAINKAYDEYLENQKELKEPIEREDIYCCRCQRNISDFDYFQDLTDEQYLEELNINHWCGGSERFIP